MFDVEAYEAFLTDIMILANEKRYLDFGDAVAVARVVNEYLRIKYAIAPPQSASSRIPPLEQRV